jgi:hypothetical protein
MKHALLCMLALTAQATTATAESSAQAPSAALLIEAPSPAARVEEARRQLSPRYRLVGERTLLEEPTDRAAQPRAALERAHQRLRRFDLNAVASELADARAAAAALEPTAEARALTAEIEVREAELAIVQRDPRAQERAMALALSARPDLTLDPEREPPPLVALVARTRSAIARAPRAILHVESTPPGAQLWVGGVPCGTAPVELELPLMPQVISAVLDGYQPTSVRVADAAHPVTLALRPLDGRQRLQQLVERIRRGDAAQRRQAAEALAAALPADAVFLLGSDGALRELTARTAPPPPPRPISLSPSSSAARPAIATTAAAPAPARPWYRRGWTWGIIAGVAAAAVVAGVVGYLATPPPAVDLTCCK